MCDSSNSHKILKKKKKITPASFFESELTTVYVIFSGKFTEMVIMGHKATVKCMNTVCCRKDRDFIFFSFSTKCLQTPE